jgi:hypothetical protein
LLLAVFRLSWLREASGLSRVNWRDMGPEELGSVYEGLLELQPQITQGGRAFGFATDGEAKGHARKTTGSYYTPDSLVQVLLDTALEPVVQSTIAAHPEKSIQALLELSIVDPACGSGHFLLGAARRLAAHVARLQANGTPSATEYRHALRQVVGRCIYGVDLNPMAVELCKVSLWMEAVEPGLPLTFLNSHIQHGNALLGATPELMENGVPDAAWDPIEGDDKKVASALKKRNKKASAGQRGLSSVWSEPGENEAVALARAIADLEAASDADAGALARKESQWESILGSEAYRHQRFVADAWCAAFVWPKHSGALSDAAPTNELWRQIRDGQGRPPTLTVTTTGELATQYDFFHWHLAFQQIFARGGFDVVLGNPPWERVKLQEQEFFAWRNGHIATSPNAAARKRLIAALPETDPRMWAEWCSASREAEGQSHFVRQSGRYPLCGKGDVNTYALFAEHNRTVLGSNGRAGFIVPSGLVTDDTTKDFFQSVVETKQLASVFHFENEDKLFAEVHHAFRFLLLTLDGSSRSDSSDLLFFARNVSALGEGERHFSLSTADFAVLNPNTHTCPTFRSRRDAALNLNIYRRTGILTREIAQHGNPWNIDVRTRTWHMAEDAELFRTNGELIAADWRLAGTSFSRGSESYVPLIEGKMVYQFDHRFGTYEGQTEAQDNQGKLPELDDAAHADPNRLALPYYWVPGPEVNARLAGMWHRKWLLGWRDITGTEKQRTVIACVLPLVGTGHTIPLIFPAVAAPLIAALYANLCTYVLDYASRQKVGGTHLTYNYLKQLPVLAPTGYGDAVPWQNKTTVADWLLLRVLELTYTAWDLEPFAHDVGYDGPPFRWDPARRFLLRAEIDAAFFHLYGISRDDSAHVLDSFPIVRKNDEKAHGNYRTKDAILEIYDRMVEATTSGLPYASLLDPPPADSRVAHAPRTVAFNIPKMPAVLPVLTPDDETAITIWAILHASGGTITRMDLARSFALRSKPAILNKLARPFVAEIAQVWAEKVGTRAVASGQLARVLKTLAERDGVKLTTDASSRSVVATSTGTPPEDKIAPWFQFEARLALQVLAALPPQEVGTVDAGMTGEDRILLEAGVA